MRFTRNKLFFRILGGKTMKLFYIHHSSFLLEMDKSYLLFDYFKREIPKLNPDKHLYVFSSHSHPDHYRDKIFDMYRDRGNVTFILSDDIEPKLESDAKMAHFVGPNKEYEIDGIKVKTFLSTDLGVAFTVEVEDKKIYHSGDLNWWTWEGFESEEEYQIMTDSYQAEVEKLKGESFDLAMVVLDPRQQDRYDWGIKYLLERINTRYLVPMHCWDKFEVIDRFKEDNPELLGQFELINTPDAVGGIELDF